MIALHYPFRGAERWLEALRAAGPDLEVRLAPDIVDPCQVRQVIAWRLSPGDLDAYPNLALVSSIGAGVDGILSAGPLPRGVRLTRVVHPSLAEQMVQYVVLSVLAHLRHWDVHRSAQLHQRWDRRASRRASELPVGILGLGVLGRAVAEALCALRFPVCGWSLSEKQLVGVASFNGPDQLGPLLQQSQVLICLLPLTPSTTGILSRTTLSQLPRGAYLINVGRGAHLIEQDLLELLDSDHLSGACLDVFNEEPLPTHHPFWRHPKVIVTPHLSSITSPEEVAPQLIAHYRHLTSGAPLCHEVDLTRGY